MVKAGRDGSGWTPRARQMAALLRRYEGSGLTLREVSARSQVPVGTLAWWRHTLRRRSRPEGTGEVRPQAEPPRFLPVQVLSPPTGERSFEVELASGARVRVPADFSAEALSRLLAVLDRC